MFRLRIYFVVSKANNKPVLILMTKAITTVVRDLSQYPVLILWSKA